MEGRLREKNIKKERKKKERRGKGIDNIKSGRNTGKTERKRKRRGREGKKERGCE
jgi:hypothetical protein